MTTDLEALRAIEQALEQAQDCVSGEQPEDMTYEEANDDTIQVIRKALSEHLPIVRAYCAAAANSPAEDDPVDYENVPMRDVKTYIMTLEAAPDHGGDANEMMMDQSVADGLSRIFGGKFSPDDMPHLYVELAERGLCITDFVEPVTEAQRVELVHRMLSGSGQTPYIEIARQIVAALNGLAK